MHDGIRLFFIFVALIIQFWQYSQNQSAPTYPSIDWEIHLQFKYLLMGIAEQLKKQYTQVGIHLGILYSNCMSSLGTSQSWLAYKTTLWYKFCLHRNFTTVQSNLEDVHVITSENYCSNAMTRVWLRPKLAVCLSVSSSKSAVAIIIAATSIDRIARRIRKVRFGRIPYQNIAWWDTRWTYSFARECENSTLTGLCTNYAVPRFKYSTDGFLVGKPLG